MSGSFCQLLRAAVPRPQKNSRYGGFSRLALQNHGMGCDYF
nr:MAG TPA: hypothetical protein [Caudoviricetes sp.]